MRLSVFRLDEINQDEYAASIARILDGRSIDTSEGRRTFVAVYNGSVLGIASADRGVLDFFNVLDITRGRGVGGYLMKTAANQLLDEYGSVTISQRLYAQPDFKLFSEHMGFENAVLTRAIEKNY